MLCAYFPPFFVDTHHSATYNGLPLFVIALQSYCGYVDEEELTALTHEVFKRYELDGHMSADKVNEAAKEVFTRHGGNMLPVSD